MSPQRQFEGPDVRALLDEICAEYGTEPTIAKAETFRSGGVLGFFQREQYRLVVDDPNAATATAPVKPGRRQAKSAPQPRLRTTSSHAAALQALAMAPGPVDAPTGEHPAVVVEPATTVQQAVGAYSQVAAGQYDDEPTADEFLASLVTETAPAAAMTSGDMFVDVASDTTDEVELTWAAPAPALVLAPALTSVPTPVVPDIEAPDAETSFEDVLRRVTAAVDSEAEPIEWPRVDRTELTAVPVVEEEVDMPSAELLERLGLLEAFVASTPSYEPAPAAHFAPAEPQVESDTVEPEPAGSHFALVSADEVIEPTPAPAEVDPAQVAARETRRQQARRLLATGLHHRTVVAVLDALDEGWSLEASILDAMEDLPLTQLPRDRGSLIVVIGPGRRAAEEATRMAGDLGGDPSRVAFATDRRPVWQAPEDLLLTSAAAARQVRDNLTETSVGLVALDAPTGSRAQTTTWARYVLDALEPTHVVVIADAMHKNEDVAAWIESLGGADSIVIDNTDLTTSPAAVLELGLPVSRLGQKPATPARWAATVLDRLEDDFGAAAPTLDLTTTPVIEVESEMSKWV